MADDEDLLKSGELEAFDIPLGFEHPREFSPDAPRPIPRHCRFGPYIQERLSNYYTALMVGAISLVLSNTSLIEELAWYVLPLKYLDWIGYALLIAGVLGGIRCMVGPARFR